MVSFKHLTLLAALATTTVIAHSKDRIDKAIGIFNVVQFPNDLCVSSTNARNGTCYTAEECADRSGTASGSCANGYGVCCVITATCGSSTSENCTYLVQDSSNSPSTNAGSTTGCSYEICPLSSDISRIRLDMTTFQLSGPTSNPELTGTGIAVNTGSAIGACVDDTFTVSGSTGSVPVICGSNDGQHMIVDTDGSKCVTAMFTYGAATNTRSYVIHVLQYHRLNEMGGPADCLQFYTGTTGTVKTFNYASDTTSTHLQGQDYNICVRSLADMCVLCWSPTTTGISTAGAVTTGSFGLSNGFSTDAAANAAAAGTLSGQGDVKCADDHVVIPGGLANAAAANTATIPGGATIIGGKFCGRRFNADIDGNQADASICSRVKPFRMRVVTDDAEVAAAAAVAMQAMNEGSIAVVNTLDPRGTLGFSLGFAQTACA